MIRGGLWLSEAARNDGEPPVVWLHHEPRLTPQLNDGDGPDFYVGPDSAFDLLAMALLAARDRFVTLALGLLLVGHWEIASVPTMPRIIGPRLVVCTPVRVLTPVHLRTSIHSTAPPARTRGAGQTAAMTT